MVSVWTRLSGEWNRNQVLQLVRSKETAGAGGTSPPRLGKKRTGNGVPGFHDPRMDVIDWHTAAKRPLAGAREEVPSSSDPTRAATPMELLDNTKSALDSLFCSSEALLSLERSESSTTNLPRQRLDSVDEGHGEQASGRSGNGPRYVSAETTSSARANSASPGSAAAEALAAIRKVAETVLGSTDPELSETVGAAWRAALVASAEVISWQRLCSRRPSDTTRADFLRHVAPKSRRV